MRPVLLISYHWPRNNYVGMVRPSKLAKFLPRYGWLPVVLTVEEKYYDSTSPEMPSDVSGVPTIRTGCLRSPRAAYVWLKGRLATIRGRESEYNEIRYFDRDVQWRHESPQTESAVRRIKRGIVSLLHTPDDHQGWIPFAVTQSLRVLKQRGITCVITTGPPFTTHLIGLAIKKLSRVSWVADFRDPWSLSTTKPFFIRSQPGRVLDGWLEAQVMTNADRVVCVTPAMTESYRRLYRTLPAHKWVTITNGFDPDDFEGLVEGPPPEEFNVSYIGDFAYDRTPEPLLRALGELVAKGEMDPMTVSVRFVGSCRYACGRPVGELVSKYGLDEVVKIVDALPRAQALQEMVRAHVLVLLATKNQPLQVPGKTYEYIACDRRILALTEKGATADIVEQVAGGAVVSPKDHEGVKHILRTWYEEYRAGCGRTVSQAVGRVDTIEQYDWRKLGSRYAELLEATDPVCL